MTISAGGARVDLRGLTKAYSGNTVLSDVSLDIAPGEFMTLLGPSGSGKSTTLNIVAGFALPDSGNVTIGASDVTDLPPYRRNIGMVFQNYALFPHMDVKSNIAFPLKQRRVKKREITKMVDDVLHLVELSHLGDRFPKELSGGQQQRVALARALVYRPEVLLLDEPLGALDKRLRESLQLEIMRIHRELGTTFIFVTHDQDEALTMSDRIAVFNEGKIVQVGTPSELYRNPKSLFVAEFLGDSNIFHGEVAVSNGRPYFKWNGMNLLLPEGVDLTGGSGSLMVRPECVRVSPFTSTSSLQQGHVPGTITEVIFKGDTSRVLVGLDDSDLQIGLNVPVNEPHPIVRDKVSISWDPQESVFIPAKQRHETAPGDSKLSSSADLSEVNQSGNDFPDLVTEARAKPRP